MVYNKSDTYIIHNDSCLNVMEEMEENSVDSIVTDPPYEINFMAKGWDNTGVAFNVDTWRKALRVLKPGGYLLAFSHSRTFHRMAVAIEDAGFEIRDTIMWLYGTGFPKSYNIGLNVDQRLGQESITVGSGKSGVSSRAYQSEEETTSGEYEIKKANNKWDGWGTALKPSFEPIIMARKPLDGSIVDNILTYEVGGINIDECRIDGEPIQVNVSFEKEKQSEGWGTKRANTELQNQGRFPANVIHDDSEEVVSLFPNDGEVSSARFFYSAKASVKDRDEGLNSLEEKELISGGGRSASGYDETDEEQRTLKLIAGKYGAVKAKKKNIHPTVKPTSLMQYLVRLVTPPNGWVLDPFMGSGSTGKAAMFENRERNSNYKFIGIDLTEEYCEIAKLRIDFALTSKIEVQKVKDENGELKTITQLSLFD